MLAKTMTRLNAPAIASPWGIAFGPATRTRIQGADSAMRVEKASHRRSGE
jgi:hypothetical protein